LQPVAIICASGETRTRCKHLDKQVTFSLVKILKLQNRCQIVVQGWQKKHPDEAGQVVFGSEGTVHPVKYSYAVMPLALFHGVKGRAAKLLLVRWKSG